MSDSAKIQGTMESWTSTRSWATMSNEVVKESYSYVTENMVENTVSINYDKMMCARRRWLEQD
eukprot:8903929-Heterocapsa_arctica.AAC.1